MTTRLGLLPGAFNPPTLAHAALAEAALRQYRLDRVIFLLPKAFPHKPYSGASFADRMAMLEELVQQRESFTAASADGLLFIDFARAFRAKLGPEAAIYLICGRDAAKRIVEWDYGDNIPFAERLNDFPLLVASREGDYAPPADSREGIHRVKMPEAFDEILSSRVREAIASGGEWRQHVAPPVARRIEEWGLYRAGEAGGG